MTRQEFQELKKIAYECKTGNFYLINVASEKRSKAIIAVYEYLANQPQWRGAETNQRDDILRELSQARDTEEHYRDLLLFWKQRRQRFEAQLIDDPVGEIAEIVEELFNDESYKPD